MNLELSLVAMLDVVTRRPERNRNSVQSMEVLVLFTLVIAAMFIPLQWVVQAGVGRRFYQRKL